MKKTTIAGLASVIALVLAPSSALAIDTPVSSAWMGISPCDADCLYTVTIDPTSGAILDEFEDTTDTEYQFEAEVAEIDPVNENAYFVAAGELYVYDLTTTGNSTFLADETDLPSTDGHFRGLAYDHESGNLYVFWWDGDASHYYLHQFDPDSQAFVGDGLELDDYLIINDAYDAAISGNSLYVLTSGDEMVELDVVSGDLVEQIPYPFNSYVHSAISTDSNGNLRVALLNEDYDYETHLFVYSDSWSEPVDLNRQVYALAWWDREPDDSGAGENAPETLAATGLEPGALIAGSALLVLVGGTLGLRRRARR